MADNASIVVGLDFSKALSTDAPKAAQRLNQLFNNGVNLRGISEPLGRVTGKANEFSKSLEAANARLLAFSLSAAPLFALERGLTKLVTSTVQVQKSLTEIGVISDTSGVRLRKLGDQLFAVANKTSQSFEVASKTALEFSRQGLKIDETLKRTQNALILTRLATIDTATAVETITAAINSFNNEMLDSTDIVNRFAALDSKFAVSANDLSEAIRRVGSSAKDTNVSFNELAALVTSVQQTTARGGANIGEALKTIFTRLGRSDTIEDLKALGVAINESQSGIEKLKALSTAIQGANVSQANQIKELAGGVYRINIVSAALGDLSNKYSIYSRALDTAANAQDNAIDRNEKLNQSLSSLGTRTLNNVTNLFSKVGSLSLEGPLTNLAGGVNKALESLIDSSKSESLGEKFGAGLFKGLGDYIQSGGALLVGSIGLALAKKLGSFAKDSFGTIKFAGNSGVEEKLRNEQAILNILQNNNNIQEKIRTGELSIVEAKKAIIAELQREIALREKVVFLARETASILPGAGIGFNRYTGAAQRKGGGTIPNFSALSDAINREKRSGIPANLIKVGQDKRLVSNDNPFGVGVYNLVDEPNGLGEGIARSIREGKNPKTYGGGIPSFADNNNPFFIQRTVGFQPAKQAELNAAYQKLIVSIVSGAQTQQSATLQAKDLIEKYNVAKSGIEKINTGITSALLILEQNTKSVGAQQFAAQTAINEKTRLRIASAPRLGEDLTQSLTILAASKASIKSDILVESNKKAAQASLEAAQKSKELADKLPNIKVSTYSPETPFLQPPGLQGPINRIAVSNPNASFSSPESPSLQGPINRMRIKNAYEKYDPTLGSETSDQARQRRLNEGFERELGNIPFRSDPYLEKFKISIPLPQGYNMPTKADPAKLAEESKRLEEAFKVNREKFNKISKEADSLYKIFSQGKIRKQLESLGALPEELSRFDQERTSRFQNRALVGSLLLPTVLGGISNSISSETAGGRTAQAALGGIGTAGSIGLTLSSLGATAGTAGIGAGVAALASIPKIFDAFTNTIPDLTEKLEKLQDVTTRNSASVQSFIDNSEKLAQARRGELSGVTQGQIRQLERQQNLDLARIPDTQKRLELKGLIESGNFDKAREFSGNIQLQEQQKIGSLQSRIRLQEIARQSGFGNSFGNNVARLGTGSGLNQLLDKIGYYSAGARQAVFNPLENLLSGPEVFRENVAAEQLNFRIPSILRDRKQGNLFSRESQGQIFGSINEKGESFIETLAKNKETLIQLESAKTDEEFNKIFKSFASKTNFQEVEDYFDTAIQQVGKESENFAKGFYTSLRKSFTQKSIETRITDPVEVERSSKEFQNYFGKINASLLNSGRIFDEFGSRLDLFNQKAQISTEFTDKLQFGQAEFAGKLALIKQGGSNEYLSNVNQGTLARLRNQQSLSAGQEKLTGNFNLDTFNVFNKLRDSLLEKIPDLAAERGATPTQKLEIKEATIGRVNSLLGEASGLGNIDLSYVRPQDFGEEISRDISSKLKSFLSEFEREGTGANARFQGLGLKPEQQKIFADSIRSATTALDEYTRKLAADREILDIQIKNSNKEIGIELKNTADLLGARFAAEFGSQGISNQIGQDINARNNRFTLGSAQRGTLLTSQSLSAGGSELIALNLQKELADLNGQFQANSINKPLELIGRSDILKNLGVRSEGDIQSQIQKQKTLSSSGFGPFFGPRELATAKNSLQELLKVQQEIENTQKTENENLKVSIALAEERVKQEEIKLNFARQFAEFRSKEELNNVVGNIAANGTFSGSGNQSGFGSLVRSQLEYGPKDFYKEVAEGTVDTIQAVRKGFGSAIGEMIRSGKGAGEAFRETFLNVLGNIAQKTTDIGVNSLIGGLTSLGSSYFGKANGGIIQGFSTGGTVEGGSGTKDDVPALLTKGEYVISRKAVDMVGTDFLNNLNYGDKNSVKLNLKNAFAYDNERSPTSGMFDVDKNLSSFALTDTDLIRTNQLKFEREGNFYQYQKDRYDYEQNKLEALAAFKAQKRNRLIGAYISAGIGVAGAGISSYAKSLGTTGGAVTSISGPNGTLSSQPYSASLSKGVSGGFDFSRLNAASNFGSSYNYRVGYATGGRVLESEPGIDTIPALLTGGEYVIKNDVVRKYGAKFFDSVNKGKIPSRFANGGFVNDGQVAPISQIGNSRNDTVGLLSSIALGISTLNSSIAALSNRGGSSGGDSGVKINNYFTIEIKSDSVGAKSKSSGSGDKSNDSRFDAEGFRKTIVGIVQETLTTDLRQGGRLREFIDKR